MSSYTLELFLHLLNMAGRRDLETWVTHEGVMFGEEVRWCDVVKWSITNHMHVWRCIAFQLLAQGDITERQDRQLRQLKKNILKGKSIQIRQLHLNHVLTSFSLSIEEYTYFSIRCISSLRLLLSVSFSSIYSAQLSIFPLSYIARCRPNYSALVLLLMYGTLFLLVVY